jgi:hypothetical protein
MNESVYWYNIKIVNVRTVKRSILAVDSFTNTSVKLDLEERFIIQTFRIKTGIDIR